MRISRSINIYSNQTITIHMRWEHFGELDPLNAETRLDFWWLFFTEDEWACFIHTGLSCVLFVAEAVKKMGPKCLCDLWGGFPGLLSRLSRHVFHATRVLCVHAFCKYCLELTSSVPLSDSVAKRSFTGFSTVRLYQLDFGKSLAFGKHLWTLRIPQVPLVVPCIHRSRCYPYACRSKLTISTWLYREQYVTGREACTTEIRS